MPLPLAGTITLAAAGVAAAALVVALALPTPAPAGGTWVDYPQSGSTIATGLTGFTAHASARSTAPVDQFRFELEDAKGTVLVVENDLHPVVSGHDSVNAARTLYVGRALWEAVPGSYILAESYLDGGSWTDDQPITFTVAAPAPAVSASPTPPPTIVAPSSTPTPTPTPTPTASAAPTPRPAPSPAPTGQVTVTQETHSSGGATVLLTATGVTPGTAVVDLQVQIVANGAPYNPAGTWTSEGCGNLTQAGNGTYQCGKTVSVENPYQHAAATGWTRVQVTAGGQIVTNYGPSFAVHANIN